MATLSLHTHISTVENAPLPHIYGHRPWMEGDCEGVGVVLTSASVPVARLTNSRRATREYS